MSDTNALARQVDGVAAAVDGVVRVYSAAPVLIGVVKTALPADSALSVVRGSDPLDVAVSVGVDAAQEGAAVAQRVVDAVREELGVSTVVHVRISRVVPAVNSDEGR